jgi:hypothetical protein
VGKSAVAIAGARSVAPNFPDGTFYFALDGDSPDRNAWMTPQSVAAEVLAILGGDARPADDKELYALYAERLRGQRVLIVLDNAIDQAHVQPLLQNIRPSCLIVTSRDRGVPASTAVHRHMPTDVPVLPRAESTELLLKYVADCGEPSESAGNALACGRIAEYCDDLPAALHLAGQKMLFLYEGDFTERLRNMEEDLKEEATRLGRIGLAPVISLSYASLDDATRRVLRMSSTTRGTAITGSELGYCLGIEAEAAEDGLGRLVDGSLARYGTRSASRDRSFALYQMVRLFADWRRQKEEPVEAIGEFQRRFAQYISRRCASDSGRRYPDPDEKPEVAAALTAAQLASDNDWLEEGIPVAERLVRVLPVEAEGERLLDAHRALAGLRVKAGQGERAIAGWRAFAGQLRERNRADEAITAYQEARDLAGRLERPLLRAQAGIELSVLLESRAKSSAALQSAFEAMADAAATLRDSGLEVEALPVATDCARLARRRYRPDDTLTWARVAGEIASAHRDASRDDRAHAMFELGRALHDAGPGQHQEAVRAYVTAGRLFERGRQFPNAAIAVGNAARLSSGGQKIYFFRIAARRWGQAGAGYEQARHAEACVTLSAALAAADDLDGAAAPLREAIEVTGGDAEYAAAAAEARVRLVALGFLAGTAAPAAGCAELPAAGDGSRLDKVSRELSLLNRLCRGEPSSAQALDVLRVLVASGPRYAPAGYGDWLHGRMGAPGGDFDRAEADWLDDDPE